MYRTKKDKSGVQKKATFQDLKMGNATFSFRHYIEYLSLDLEKKLV